MYLWHSDNLWRCACAAVAEYGSRYRYRDSRGRAEECYTLVAARNVRCNLQKAKHGRDLCLLSRVSSEIITEYI